MGDAVPCSAAAISLSSRLSTAESGVIPRVMDEAYEGPWAQIVDHMGRSLREGDRVRQVRLADVGRAGVITGFTRERAVVRLEGMTTPRYLGGVSSAGWTMRKSGLSLKQPPSSESPATQAQGR
jgi:hypothetical protein